MIFDSGTDRRGLFIGSFVSRYHDVGGKVYALNSSTLLVRDFTYDGGGPDAFFWAGTTGNTPTEDGVILPYPFEGRFYDYDDDYAPVLGRFRGEEEEEEDLLLHLPPGLEVNQVRWLSVWCRAFTVNFGEVVWPEGVGRSEGSQQDEVEAGVSIEVLRGQGGRLRPIEKKNIILIPVFVHTAETTTAKIDSPFLPVDEIGAGCIYKGKVYSLGEDFHDGCKQVILIA